MSEWVEIIEPRTQEHMFANLSTGECLWDPPVGVAVKKTNADQWWELFDQNTARFYYYNASSQKTVWHRPKNCDIIPLAKLQTLKQNTQVKSSSSSISSTINTRDLSTQTPSSTPLDPLSPPSSSKSVKSATVQTLEEASPRRKQRHYPHNHHHHHHHQQQQQQSNTGFSQSRRRTTIGGADAKYYASPSSSLSKQRSLEVLQQSPSKRNSSSVRPHKLNSEYSSISRSVSFMSRNEPNASWKSNDVGKRSVESTPQSSRRKSTEYGRKSQASQVESGTDNISRKNGSKTTPKIMTPLQKYILDQAKLSGYRFGDPILGDDRDSIVESEDDHRHDDSDDFADDEEAGSEDDFISSSKASSSSDGEEDEGEDYLSEPTYHNIGWNLPKVSDTDAFSEEFDQRMRLGGRFHSTNVASHQQHHVSTIPRPGSLVGGGLVAVSSHPPPPQYPVPYDVASLQRNQIRNNHHFHPHGGSYAGPPQVHHGSSTLSVSTSIHSTISCESDIEKYAQDNMNVQKKGLFRRKMTVKDILSWTAEGISKPLTCLSEKSVKKEAVELFKLIQIYMGDRKAKVGMTINSVALDVTTGGYLKTSLRDEIFVQLCKQTTDNPRKESLRRGWELLAICLAFFPPSPAFSHCLNSYISRHRDPALDDFPDLGKWPIHVQISHFAGICAKRLERIGEGGHLVPKKPTVEDIDQSRLQIFRPSMFGGTLEETLEMQRDRFPHTTLPWILTTLADQVIQLNGAATEGTFRVPADMEEVNNLKSRFDQWEVPICADCHTAASLLKLWFRELYEPIIPSYLYQEAVSNPDDPEFAVNLVRRRLPDSNKNVLVFLIRFLQTFDRPEIIAITKMDSSNLSTVFAPNVLRCPSNDPSVILENARKEMAFVKTLITHYPSAETDNPI